jgi:hypothetical protein
VSIEQRIEKAERKLGMDEQPTVVNVVMFSDGPLPPEERRGNLIVRHVAYRGQEGAANDAR